MYLTLISLIAALMAGQSSQSMGATEALRPPPTPPTATVPATTEATPTEPLARPRQICRNEQVTGTRFPIRRCRNAVQTEAERAEGRDMLRRMQGARTPPQG